MTNEAESNGYYYTEDILCIFREQGISIDIGATVSRCTRIEQDARIGQGAQNVTWSEVFRFDRLRYPITVYNNGKDIWVAIGCMNAHKGCALSEVEKFITTTDKVKLNVLKGAIGTIRYHVADMKRRGLIP